MAPDRHQVIVSSGATITPMRGLVNRSDAPRRLIGAGYHVLLAIVQSLLKVLLQFLCRVPSDSAELGLGKPSLNRLFQQLAGPGVDCIKRRLQLFLLLRFHTVRTFRRVRR
jgi:hypothetical protein